MKKLILTTLAVLGTSITPAMADHTGFYVGGSLGAAFHDQNENDWTAPGLTTTYDNTSLGFKGFVGYKFNQYLAVEGGYTDLGNYEATVTDGVDTGNAEIDTTSWNAFGVASLPFCERFSAFGKAGVALNNSDMSFTSGGVSFLAADSGDDSRVSFAWGLGLAASITPEFTARVEFEDLGKAGETNSGFTVPGRTSDSHPRMLSVGVQYNF